MDFEFINTLINSLKSQNIFNYAFTGTKVLAMAFLLFRFLETYIKNFETESPQIGGVLTVLGSGLMIMSGGWIIDSIENIFAGVDAKMHGTSSDLYTDLMNNIWMKFEELFEGCDAWYDYISAVAGSLISIIFLVIGALLAILAKIADLSITAGYLVQRIFILQLLKFLFPLMLAFGTFTKMENMLYSWIKRYIGMFILGIAYIGIINFTSLIQSAVSSQFSGTDFGTGSSGIVDFGFGILVTIIITITIKIKLLHSVTSYVMSMFS
ncbi:type IV secretion system protein (plasmid) [Elizabethkingia anophelis]|uniref:type IV secretion system protein n=1 Tax=Elizabethkingia anophelis TaxID=1117645 RepID=UPI0020B78503|nr:type IV secretion system protein [Elizabethkingia anophelis]UTG66821.1 type IV secretion system protein [Elizabethkingia anophelis]